MYLTSYDYRLPPIYPEIEKNEYATWKKILDLIYRTCFIDEVYNSEDLEERIRIKDEDNLIEWFRIKLETYLSLIFKDDKPYETHLEFGIDSILPQLIEQNRFLLEIKWIIPFIRVYTQFLEVRHFDIPYNISVRFVNLMNKAYYENVKVKLTGSILKKSLSHKRIRKSIDFYFPNYMLPIRECLDLIECSKQEYAVEELIYSDRCELEWAVFCKHLNHFSNQTNEQNKILEQAFQSFIWYYGTKHTNLWLKHVQYLLDKFQRHLDYSNVIILRMWLNSTMKYYNRSREYIPKKEGEKANSIAIRLNYLEYEEDQEKADQFLNETLFSDFSKKYTTFEKALVIYLKEQLLEFKIPKNGYAFFEKNVNNSSFKSVGNQYFKIRNLEIKNKKCTISKKVLQTGLNKILQDKNLQKYHDRARSMYTTYILNPSNPLTTH
jgi:hypothetical protein